MSLRLTYNTLLHDVTLYVQCPMIMAFIISLDTNAVTDELFLQRHQTLYRLRLIILLKMTVNDLCLIFLHL